MINLIVTKFFYIHRRLFDNCNITYRISDFSWVMCWSFSWLSEYSTAAILRWLWGGSAPGFCGGSKDGGWSVVLSYGKGLHVCQSISPFLLTLNLQMTTVTCVEMLEQLQRTALLNLESRSYTLDTGCGNLRNICNIVITLLYLERNLSQTTAIFITFTSFLRHKYSS
jgi:hypothetical protein